MRSRECAPRLSRDTDEKHHRPLEMNDIAQMKALLPDIIVFAWIDSEILRVHAAGGDEKTIRRNAKTKAIDDAFESAASGSGKKKEENKEVVLLFSFNDGELKSSNGVGKLFLRKFQSVLSLSTFSERFH